MDNTADERFPLDVTDVPVLVALLVGTRVTGDRTLEATVKNALWERHGIKVVFSRAGTCGTGNTETTVKRYRLGRTK